MENSSRAFLYGESVFTTMRMISGEVKDWDLHFDRLKRGADFVFGPIEAWKWTPFRLMIEDKLKSKSGTKALRITVFAKGDLGLRPLEARIEDLEVEIQERPLPETNGEPKKLRTLHRPGKPNFWPSFLKSGNYLETILSQKYVLNPGEDDLLFCDETGLIQESSMANIFIVRGDHLLTPRLGPNVMEGTMRGKILDKAPLFFKKISEENILWNENFKADGVFLSNALRGMFLVDRIDRFEISYSNDFLKAFHELNALVMK